MTCFLVVAVPLVLLGLTALLTCVFYYVQFCNSPEKQWRDKVLGLVSAAEERVRSEKQYLRKLKGDQDAEIRRLKEEAFSSYLSSISVGKLEAYPGIGPATVTKLHEAGYVNLASLAHARIRLYGLGEKRLADIDHAVRHLLQEARRTFDQVACQQAQNLARHLDHLPAKYQILDARARARVQAAEEVADGLERLVLVARQVTFFRWFRPLSNDLMLSIEDMEADLPDPDAAVRKADSRAAQRSLALAIPVLALVDEGERANGPQVRPVPLAVAVPLEPVPAKSKTKPSTPAVSQTPSDPQNLKDAMPDNLSLLIQELTIQFALAVARADGPVTFNEREFVRNRFRRTYGNNPALLNRAEGFCAHYELAAIDWDRCLGQINQQFTAADRADLVGFAGQIIAISGKGDAVTRPFLTSLARRLGVQPVALASQAQPAKSAPSRSPAQGRNGQDQPLVTANLTNLLEEQRKRDDQNRQQPPSQTPPTNANPMRSPAPARPAPSVTSSTQPPSPTAKVVATASSGSLGPLATTPLPLAPISASPPPTPTRDECMVILEIQPNKPLSADLIRRQWNLLSQRFAAEKFATMGAEFVKIAEAKRAELRQAAELLLEPMGEKLEINRPNPDSLELRANPDLDNVFGM